MTGLGINLLIVLLVAAWVKIRKPPNEEVSENTEAYKQISQRDGKPPQSDSSPDKASTEKQTKTQQITLARHQRLKRRYQAVKMLYRQGVTKAKIARQLKIDPKTIRKYIDLDRCPTYSKRSPRPSKLSPYKG
ncbi:helix-turn-helix domain-containing protein [Candidatus Poribacteria bacterium]|nr:helix-turn-helix domain-containing protein [Candidatus Poribacteria bacterium]